MKFKNLNLKFKKNGQTINIMALRKVWYTISFAFIIPSLLALAFWGLKPSIDFTGGSKIELRGISDTRQAREFSERNGLENITAQRVGDDGVSIRFKEISEAKHEELQQKLPELGEGVQEVGFETVGPTISREITRNAFFAIGLASLIIVFYVAYSFRRVPKPVTSWDFGLAAIVALVHDTIIVLGAFAILGRFFNVEVDPLFITAVLTVISFSVHDTIVVFDRVRENLIKKGSEDIEGVVNLSVLEMMPRTLNTTFLVWVILLIMLLFGGVTIRYFVLTLVIGLIVGNYSSILNASPLLVTVQEFKKKNRS
jgi:preprotein translocase subunit SecF